MYDKTTIQLASGDVVQLHHRNPLSDEARERIRLAAMDLRQAIIDAGAAARMTLLGPYNNLDLSLGRLQLEPGDRVVVYSHRRLDLDSIEALKVQVEGSFPGHECVVLDGDLRIGAVGEVAIATMDERP